MNEAPRSPGWEPQVIEGDGVQTPRKDVSNTPLELISTDELPVEHMGGSPEDVLYAMNNLYEIPHVYARAGMLMDHIDKAKTVDSNITVPEQTVSRKEISSLSLKSLADEIIRSNEKDWDARPKFYKNVFLEYQLRTEKIAHTLMQGESDEHT
jgi:hypothetical protein